MGRRNSKSVAARGVRLSARDRKLLGLDIPVPSPIDDDLPMCEPTKALPGTAEKFQVLMARAARGVALHHPQDPKYQFDWLEERYGFSVSRSDSR